MVRECKLCKNKINDPLHVDYYERQIISLQSDFLAQKFMIVEIIENADHICIFFLKFHCELNFIECYWRTAKQYT